jgi:hypothetical protein
LSANLYTAVSRSNCGRRREKEKMISRLAQMGLGSKQTGFIPTLEMNVSAHACVQFCPLVALRYYLG